MRGPWYITPSAVADLMRIRGQSDTESNFETAQNALIEIAKEIVASGKEPTLLDNGYLRYRTGRAHQRMQLVVSETPRWEGDLPQLIAVTRSMH